MVDDGRRVTVDDGCSKGKGLGGVLKRRGFGTVRLLDLRGSKTTPRNMIFDGASLNFGPVGSSKRGWRSRDLFLGCLKSYM